MYNVAIGPAIHMFYSFQNVFGLIVKLLNQGSDVDCDHAYCESVIELPQYGRLQSSNARTSHGTKSIGSMVASLFSLVQIA